MPSSVFEEILLRAQKSSGTTRVPGALLIETAAAQKAMDLAHTIQVRREDKDSLADSDIESAERAANDYVDSLVEDMVRMDLDLLIKYDMRKKKKSKAPGEPVRSLRRRTGQFIKSADLQTLLNLTLYKYAQSLMGSPRLNNRTGRLAHSGVVTSITNSDKPMVSLYFKYMTAPYSVFEPGASAKGNAARSPSQLFKDALNIALGDILTPASKERIRLFWRR
jgi:hypothetical protein